MSILTSNALTRTSDRLNTGLNDLTGVTAMNKVEEKLDKPVSGLRRFSQGLAQGIREIAQPLYDIAEPLYDLPDMSYYNKGKGFRVETSEARKEKRKAEKAEDQEAYERSITERRLGLQETSAEQEALEGRVGARAKRKERERADEDRTLRMQADRAKMERETAGSRSELDKRRQEAEAATTYTALRYVADAPSGPIELGDDMSIVFPGYESAFKASNGLVALNKTDPATGKIITDVVSRESLQTTGERVFARLSSDLRSDLTAREKNKASEEKPTKVPSAEDYGLQSAAEAFGELYNIAPQSIANPGGLPARKRPAFLKGIKDGTDFKKIAGDLGINPLETEADVGLAEQAAQVASKRAKSVEDRSKKWYSGGWGKGDRWTFGRDVTPAEAKRTTTAKSDEEKAQAAFELARGKQTQRGVGISYDPETGEIVERQPTPPGGLQVREATQMLGQANAAALDQDKNSVLSPQELQVALDAATDAANSQPGQGYSAQEIIDAKAFLKVYQQRATRDAEQKLR